MRPSSRACRPCSPRAPFASDRERVEHLFTLYQRLVDPLGNDGARQNRRVARRRTRSDADTADTSPPPAPDAPPRDDAGPLDAR